MIALTECMEGEGSSPLASNAKTKGDVEEGRRERKGEWVDELGQFESSKLQSLSCD